MEERSSGTLPVRLTSRRRAAVSLVVVATVLGSLSLATGGRPPSAGPSTGSAEAGALTGAPLSISARGSSQPAASLAQETGEMRDPSGRFIVRYPFPVDNLAENERAFQAAQKLLSGLTEAHGKLQALGLSWEARTEPIQVAFEPFASGDDEKWGLHDPSRLGVNYDMLRFNYNKVTSDEAMGTMKITAGHELFHLMQRLYDPRGSFESAVDPGDWFWMDEAMAVWFERRMATNRTYISALVRQDNYAFLTRHGLGRVGRDVAQDHGYGASMFLEYLTNLMGDRVVGDILKLKVADTFPLGAISRILGGDEYLPSAWEGFTNDYLASGVYQGVDEFFPAPSQIIGMAAGRFLARRTQPSGTFNWEAPDLSARFYTVGFADRDWAPGTKLSLTLSAGFPKARAVVMRLEGDSQLSILGEFRDTAEVRDVEILAAQGAGLAIMVVNGVYSPPFGGAVNSISLKIEFEEPYPLVPPFPAGRYVMIFPLIAACGRTTGQMWGVPDFLVTVADGGTVSLSLPGGGVASNVGLQLPGTVTPNPNYRTPRDQRYVWSVTLEYEYRGSDPTRDPSYRIQAAFDPSGPGQIRGTITAGGCTEEFVARGGRFESCDTSRSTLCRVVRAATRPKEQLHLGPGEGARPRPRRPRIMAMAPPCSWSISPI